MYEGGKPGDTTFTYANGKTLQASGNTYTIFGYEDHQYGYLDTLYYRKTTNGIYYQYYPATSNYFGFDTPTAIEIEFLNDKLAANATFSGGTFPGTISTIPLKARVDGTILEKVATAVVGTKTYIDVIKVRLSFFSVVGTVSTEVYRIEQWYAKSAGLIKYQEYLSAPFTTPASVINTTHYVVY